MSTAKAWDFIQWDLASGTLDPTVVGVAIKSLTEKADSDDFSVDKQIFEQLMKRKKGAKKEERGFGGGVTVKCKQVVGRQRLLI